MDTPFEVAAFAAVDTPLVVGTQAVAVGHCKLLVVNILVEEEDTVVAVGHCKLGQIVVVVVGDLPLLQL